MNGFASMAMKPVFALFGRNEEEEELKAKKAKPERIGNRVHQAPKRSPSEPMDASAARVLDTMALLQREQAARDSQRNGARHAKPAPGAFTEARLVREMQSELRPEPGGWNRLAPGPQTRVTAEQLVRNVIKPKVAQQAQARTAHNDASTSHSMAPRMVCKPC